MNTILSASQQTFDPFYIVRALAWQLWILVWFYARLVKSQQCRSPHFSHEGGYLKYPSLPLMLSLAQDVAQCSLQSVLNLIFTQWNYKNIAKSNTVHFELWYIHWAMGKPKINVKLDLLWKLHILNCEIFF